MGIESRDYVRTDGHRFHSRGGLLVIPWIIGICAVVVVINAASHNRLNPCLNLSFADLWPKFQIWRLLTYGFAHAYGAVGHVLFNMIALYIFGRYVEPIYGHREFLAFYLTAILVSGLGFLALDAGYSAGMDVPDEVRSRISAVGASGGVMAVTLLAACHFPRERIYFWMVLPIELWLLASITVFVDLVGVLEGGFSVAHGAHLAGAAFGFLYHRYDWRILRAIGDWRLPDFRKMFRRRTRDVRIYQPPVEPSRDRDHVSAEDIDRLLQKISEHGEASLTDDERATLTAASRQAARRRQRPE